MTPFDWRGYLRLARELATRAEDEASLRSAISRAYYAVFGTAIDRLHRHGWTPARGQGHHHVWTTYQRAVPDVCRRIGQLGFYLRDARQSADYARVLPRPARLTADVDQSLALATQLLRVLDSLDDDERCF